MKRMMTLLLVAMLLVGCLPTGVVAAGETQTGSCTFTVSGSFANFSGTVNTDLEIVSITGGGVVGNPANGRIAFASATNVDSVSFTVTYKFPGTLTCGTYGVSASVNAKKAVFDDNGTPNGTVATTVSVSGSGSLTRAHAYGDWVVDTPATDCQHPGSKHRDCTLCGHQEVEAIPGEHQPGVWEVKTAPTCTVPGEEVRKCTVCGAEVESRAVPATGHTCGDDWQSDANEHWHACANCSDRCDAAPHEHKFVQLDADKHQKVCKICGYVMGEEAHNFSSWKKDDPNHHWKVCQDCGYTTTKEAHDYVNGVCSVCGHRKNTNTDDVVDMGDITPYGTYNAIAFVIIAIVAMAVVALINKRKSVK